mgnify:CR=1 FL=1|tara:strand:- start:3 stop:1778 length:1776 start_codon:yes stop_codon:yes gene_type:complete
MNEDELTQDDIDEYRKRRQEEYDEATKGNEEIRRKQEEDKKKGLLDEGSAFRTTAAIGTEVGLNTLLDIFSFVPPAQVAGGSAINYLAQRIRGGEFSKGEFVASGLASLLPGGAQAKSLGGVIGKTATRGAVSGAIETGAADLIDTGKIDVKNVAAGAGVGGAFGGIFGTAVGLNPDFIRKLQNRVRGGDFVPIDSGLVESVGTVGAAKAKGSGDPEGLRSLKYQEGEILANTPAKNVKLLKELNLSNDESVFVLSNYYKQGSDTSTTLSRNQVAAIESLYTTVEEFDKTKDLALPYFLKGMKGIKRSKSPELDHIAQLKSSLPFFNNAKVSQFPEITKIILEEGVYGLGHQRGNFKYLEYDVHKVKSNFFRSKVGDNGEIFFKDRDISTPTKLRAAAKEYAKIIDESNNVVADAIEQYKFMNQVDINEQELDKFVDILGNQPIRRKYSIKQIKEIFKQMEEDGFIQTSKQSQKIETEQIKAEQKEISRQQRLRDQLNKDAVSVEARQKQMESFLNENLDTFNVNPYPLGMKDESLREAAEDTYRLFKENQLALEGSVQKSLFETEEREKFIKVMMKSILNRVKRDLKKNK